MSERVSLQMVLEPPSEASFEFTKNVDELAVNRVDVVVAQSSLSPALTLRQVNLAVSVPEPVQGGEKLYAVFSLSRENLEVSEAVVSFKVKNSWFMENDVDANGVVLKKLVGGQWVGQQTALVGEQGQYYLYSSRMDGLSTFAVVAKAVAEVVFGPVKEQRKAAAALAVSEEDLRSIHALEELERLKAEPVISGVRARFAFKRVFVVAFAFFAVLTLLELVWQVRKRLEGGSGGNGGSSGEGLQAPP